MLVVGILGIIVEALLRRLPLPWYSSRSLRAQDHVACRGLGQAAQQVQAALAAGELERARQLVSWHLVSRDTSALPPRRWRQRP